MTVKVHDRAHLTATLQFQPVGDVQRCILVFGIEHGDVELGCQTDGLDQLLVRHPLHILSDSLLLCGPEVLLVPEHLLVGIPGIEAARAQLLAGLSQLPQVGLAHLHLFTPDGSFRRHKLAERHHALQFRPHDGKAFQWAYNQDEGHITSLIHFIDSPRSLLEGEEA